MGVVIDVWVADLTFPGYMDRWLKLGEQFNAAHPDHQVRVTGQDFRTFPLDIAQAAAEGRAPAVAEYYFYMVQQAYDSVTPAGAPLFRSLEGALAGRTEVLGEPVVIDDIVPALRDYYSIDGELYSMPSVGTTSLLYANMDLLRAAGVNELPRTWDEVRAVCETVAAYYADKEDGPEYPITWSNHGTFFQQAIASQGGLISDNNNGRAGRSTSVDLSSPEILAFVEWWRQLHADGLYLYTGKIPDWENTFKAFAEKQVAIRISSSNDVNYMVGAAKGGEFELGTGIFPYNSHLPYVGNAVAGTSLVVANGLPTAEEDTALAFLQFAHNTRNSADRHKYNSFIPLTHASERLLEEEGWFAEHPYHKVPSDHVNTYPDRPGSEFPPSEGALIGDFAGNQDVMTNAMGDVLTGNLTAEQAVQRYAAATVEAQELLDRYHAEAADGGPQDPDSLRVEYFRDAEPYSGMDMENVVELGRAADDDEEPVSATG